MKKITITNAYSYFNKGDSGILLGTIEFLKEMFGENNLEINILSFTPELDRKQYKKESCIKNVESNILNPHPYKHTKLGKIIAIIKLLFRVIYLNIMFFFNKDRLLKKEKVLNLLNESDLVIVCGGGYLGGKKIDSLIHLVQIDFNTKYNKRVITMGISIEPMKNMFLKYCTEKVLKKLSLVIARENITYNYLETFMNKNKILLVPDMAFMLKNEIKTFKEVEKFKKRHKYLVGITVRNWNFPESNNSKEKIYNYLNVLSEFIIKWVSEENIGFVFIPQVIVSYASDVDIAKKLKFFLPEKIRESFLIVSDDLSPLDIKSLIGNMNYFIGTRMHSNIFALSMNIPTIAISYEKKTNGIMDLVNQSEYVIDISSIDLKNLNQLFEKVIKNNLKIKKELSYQLEKIRVEIQDKLKRVI